jgi:hypothetical protein
MRDPAIGDASAGKMEIDRSAAAMPAPGARRSVTRRAAQVQMLERDSRARWRNPLVGDVRDPPRSSASMCSTAAARRGARRSSALGAQSRPRVRLQRAQHLVPVARGEERLPNRPAALDDEKPHRLGEARRPARAATKWARSVAPAREAVLHGTRCRASSSPISTSPPSGPGRLPRSSWTYESHPLPRAAVPGVGQWRAIASGVPVR